jgi:hypothetical protein
MFVEVVVRGEGSLAHSTAFVLLLGGEERVR